MRSFNSQSKKKIVVGWIPMHKVHCLRDLSYIQTTGISTQHFPPLISSAQNDAFKPSVLSEALFDNMLSRCINVFTAARLRITFVPLLPVYVDTFSSVFIFSISIKASSNGLFDVTDVRFAESLSNTSHLLSTSSPSMTILPGS